MTTAELSKRTGVPVYTIRRMAHLLDALPVGGQVGYLVPDAVDAEERLLAELRKRHGKRRKPAKTKASK